MSEHLPECPQHIHWREHFDDYWCDDDCTADCICNRLRDCEQRLWDEAYAAGFNHGRAHGERLSCSISHKHGYEQAAKAAQQIVNTWVDNLSLNYDDLMNSIDALLTTHNPNMTTGNGK